MYELLVIELETDFDYFLVTEQTDKPIPDINITKGSLKPRAQIRKPATYRDD